MSRPPDDLLSTLLEYYAPEPARGAEAIRQAAAGNWLATLAELTLRDLAGYRQGEADAGDREKLAAALAQLFREGWTAGSRHEAARVAGGLTGEQEAAAIRQAGIAELRRTLQARKFFADERGKHHRRHARPRGGIACRGVSAGPHRRGGGGSVPTAAPRLGIVPPTEPET
jgi:hypothetical protein